MRAAIGARDPRRGEVKPRRAGGRAALPQLARHLRPRDRRAGGRDRALHRADRGAAMSLLDALVLFGTLGAIIAYGIWKTRHTRDAAGYLHGGYAYKWHTI